MDDDPRPRFRAAPGHHDVNSTEGVSAQFEFLTRGEMAQRRMLATGEQRGEELAPPRKLWHEPDHAAVLTEHATPGATLRNRLT